MKIWFDTEFIDNGKTIDLISIGLVREDDSKLYMEHSGCNRDRASDWVKMNVFPYLGSVKDGFSRREIASAVHKFVGDMPEFWAYYADYDWVVLCQLFGTMMDLPKEWPRFCMDVKQACVMAGNPILPKQDEKTKHCAIYDAIWTKLAYESLKK